MKEINAAKYEDKVNDLHAKRKSARCYKSEQEYMRINTKLNNAREALQSVYNYNAGVRTGTLTVMQAARTMRAIKPYMTWKQAMKKAWCIVCPSISAHLYTGQIIDGGRINQMNSKALKTWAFENIPGCTRLVQNWHYPAYERYCYHIINNTGEKLGYLYINDITN